MTSRTRTRGLPPRRSPGASYRIAVVCLGNICRSPIAEVVLTSKIEEAGLADEVEVVSAGTGGWHVGGPMDERAAAVLTANGYDASKHRAQQFASSWFADCDLILTMDRQNHADVTQGGGPDADPERVRMFREFDPRADENRDVPDPYFGGDEGFDTVLEMVERTATSLVTALEAEVAGDRP